MEQQVRFVLSNVKVVGSTLAEGIYSRSYYIDSFFSYVECDERKARERELAKFDENRRAQRRKS